MAMPSKVIRFVLQPFARPIRYGALKIMKKLRQPDDKRPVIATSGHILEEIIIPSIFNFFREDKFRELANFKKLPASEHDRIFNELEVAGICLSVLYLRVLKTLAKPEDYHFWQDVEIHLPKQLQRILMGFGVAGSDAKLVRQLRDMRFDEYEKLIERVEFDIEIQKDLGSLAIETRWMAATTQAIAVGTVNHVRRGKIQEGDLLIQHVFRWLSSLQGKISRFRKKL